MLMVYLRRLCARYPKFSVLEEGWCGVQVCYGRPQQADEQVVLLSQVLACDATVGYEDVANVQVMKFNGQKVQNLQQLVDMIEAASESRFFVFEMDHDEVVVLDAKHARASTAEILRTHNIPQQLSQDLRRPGAAAAAANDDGVAADGSAAANTPS
eukprot:jgi/Ulvmu1/10438/UM062_0035.1